MNAMRAARLDASEESAMPAGEGVDGREQFGELRSDVRHIQSDVTDVKVEL